LGRVEVAEGCAARQGGATVGNRDPQPFDGVLHHVEFPLDGLEPVDPLAPVMRH
jgi:hypothetical protein